MDYLLTGGSGLLGTEIQKHLSCFLPRRDAFDITWPAIEIVEEMYDHEDRTLRDVRAFIHCAAYTDVPGSEKNKKRAVETNIVGTKNIVDLARVYRKKVIYISTDYVYPGTDGNYKEDDATEPFNFYGFTKLGGEAYIDTENNLIIRTSFKPRNLWVEKYDSAFVDLYTSADYIDVVAKDIANVIKSGITGIINVATERKSIYDLAVKTNPNVKKISVKDVKDVRMPRDISMNIDRLNKVKELWNNE